MVPRLQRKNDMIFDTENCPGVRSGSFRFCTVFFCKKTFQKKENVLPWYPLDSSGMFSFCKTIREIRVKWFGRIRIRRNCVNGQSYDAC